MHPYYQDEAVTIYYGDCREILPDFTPRLIITDPVYDQLWAYDFLSRQSDVLLVWSGVRFLDKALDTIRRNLVYRGLFAYVNQTSGHMIGKMINKTHFLIWADRQGDSKMHQYLPNGYISVGWGMEKDYHPWAKNPKFVKKVVAAFSEPGEYIFDPFMGAGVLLRVAKDLGRKAIGIEKDKFYCDLAARRMAQTVML